jgi:hypothetical protein
MTAAEVISASTSAWNAGDDAERLRLPSAACLPDAVFASPQGPAAGIAALSASIGEFRRAFPAAVVSLGRPDEHGGLARVAWTTQWNNGSRPGPLAGGGLPTHCRNHPIGDQVAVPIDGSRRRGQAGSSVTERQGLFRR